MQAEQNLLDDPRTKQVRKTVTRKIKELGRAGKVLGCNPSTPNVSLM